jgi:hypothetical protein
MITGYNTDVRHWDLVLHVQTEDRGLDNPIIESVVYVRGQVLATKRSNYAHLLEAGKTEEDIARLMEHQHRTILAAIRAGKFDSRILQVLGPNEGGRTTRASAGNAAATPPSREAPSLTRALTGPELGVESSVPAEAPELTEQEGEEEVEALSLDQMILDYLAQEAEQEHLLLSLDGEEELQPGKTHRLTLKAFSSKTGLPLAGVQIAVRMISTVADPRTLLVTETDESGCAALELELPPLDRGSAALIFSGFSTLGRAEIKQLI